MKKFLPTYIVIAYTSFVYALYYLGLPYIGFVLVLPFRLVFKLVLNFIEIFAGDDFRLITPAGIVNLI